MLKLIFLIHKQILSHIASFFDRIFTELIPIYMHPSISTFRAHFSVELADNFSVRFIFRGQELREECSTLGAYHVEDNSVIHCLLSRISQSEQATTHTQPFNIDLGFLMFPLFGLILGLLWYWRIMYRSYFSAVSTLSLVGITFLFLAVLLASWRHEERLERED